MVGRMRYAPTTGYVRSFEIPMQFSNWVRARVQKMDLYTPPSVASGGRMRYAPTAGYVRFFKKLSRFRPLRDRLWGVFDTPLRPGTCGPSKNYPVFVSFGAVCGAYAIRPYDRVCAALRKTVSFPSLSGPRGGAYSIRPYDRVHAIFRNTDAIPRPGMCAPSKYLCNTPTGYVRSFEILIRSLDRRGGDFWEVGRWGLPFAGKVGVNEFGEEEDDDQDDDDKGA